MHAKYTKQDREEAKAELRKLLPPGSTVYTILRHVSQSGMTRDISVVIIEDGRPRRIDHLVIKAGIGNWPPGYNPGIRVGGAGMDMGFHIVYSLSRTLYPDGFDCLTYERGEEDATGRVHLGERKADAPEYGGCPANDHFNRDTSYHHRDGGYALKQEWL